MKTRLLYGMFAAVGMMLATSCLNDERLALSGNEAQVTFSLGIENGMHTRAISDGSGVNQLIYAVFDSEGKLLQGSNSAEDVEFPAKTTLTLVSGQQYTAVFWAQNKACKAYSISEDMKVITVNYEGANNDETRDAFFKSETFTVTEDTEINVVLKRPFAQLNVGITNEEWENASNQGVVITTSEVTVKQAATELNLIDGSVGEPLDVTFTAAKIPAEPLKVDIDCNGVQEEYKYLSMSYFLAYDANGGAAKTTLDALSFTFNAEDGTRVVLDQGLANAPVQRNHRTNIVAFGEIESILTNDIDVKVTLDPLYDGEHTFTDVNVWEDYKGIYTEEALAGMTIEIPAGWHIRNGYILEPMPESWTAESTPVYTKPYTVDGNGNTVTFEPYSYEYVTKNAFAAADGALVTVKDIVFAGEHSGIYGGVWGSGKNYNNIFENVQIVENGIYCYNENGSVPVAAFANIGITTLENCKITGTYWVGAEKDENANASVALNLYGSVYDVFVANEGTNTINNCVIGSVYIQEHGKLTVSGTTEVEKIISKQLVKGTLTITGNAKVKLVDVNQYSDSHPPIVTIEAGATVETLQLNSIKKTNINIAEGAVVGKIIYKDTEYTVEEFKAL